MSFGLYSIEFAIVIGGLTYAAYLLHMPAHWIAAGAIVLVGTGVLKGSLALRAGIGQLYWLRRASERVSRA
jgi:hypothetical protein